MNAAKCPVFNVGASIWCIVGRTFCHMTHTAPRALSLQNYRENPGMRAIRDGASRARKVTARKGYPGGIAYGSSRDAK